MKYFFVFSLIVLIILAPLHYAFAFDPFTTPFGGPILEGIVCVFPVGDLVTILNLTTILGFVGPPAPLKLMYTVGESFSFAYGPPYRIGQYLLGRSGPPTVCIGTCDLEDCILGVGDLIIFHGSSL